MKNSKDKCICGHTRLSHKDFSWKPGCKVGRTRYGFRKPACLCNRFRLKKRYNHECCW